MLCDVNTISCTNQLFNKELVSMQDFERMDAIIGGLKQLRKVMLGLSIALLLISFFSVGVTFLEGVVLTAFSAFIFCQRQFSPIAYRYFIITLLVAIIFDAGTFLEYIGSKMRLKVFFIIIKGFNVAVLFLLSVIVWRHLQFCQVLHRFQQASEDIQDH